MEAARLFSRNVEGFNNAKHYEIAVNIVCM